MNRTRSTFYFQPSSKNTGILWIAVLKSKQKTNSYSSIRMKSNSQQSGSCQLLQNCQEVCSLLCHMHSCTAVLPSARGQRPFCRRQHPPLLNQRYSKQ